MTRLTRPLPVRSTLLVAAGAFLLAASGCEGQANAAPERRAGAAATQAEALLAVTLAKGRTVRGAARETVTGTLFPAQGLRLGFEVGGRLESIQVKKGDRVKAGDVLATLNTEVADAQVAQAEAGVAAAEAGAAIAEDLAARNVKLQEEGSVSDLQSKQATTQSKQAQAQLLSARAALAQARAGRRRHLLRAPFAGTVVDAPEQVGATVGPGTPLFGLEQLDTLLLKTTVAENQRRLLQPGAKVKVSAVGAAASTEEATVRTVVPSADPATRRVPVDIVVPNPEGQFVAHTLARAQLELGEAQDLVALPASALSSSGGDHVFALGPNRAARKVEVTVVERTGREVVVRAEEPLSEVVDSPPPQLAEGSQVSVK